MENKPYLYASSSLWLKHQPQSFENIFTLSEKFQLVSTSVQIDRFKSELFGSYPLQMDILDENPSDAEIQLLRSAHPDFFQKYALFKTSINKYISLIISLDTAELEAAMILRIEEKLPPFFLGDNRCDIISWLGILHCTEVPQGAHLYIYGTEQDFLHQRAVHPYLSHEWKYIKRGSISAYDPAMFTRMPVFKEAPPTPKNNERKPEFLRSRFLACIENVIHSVEQHPLHHPEECRALLGEAREYLTLIEGKIPSESLLGMKRLYNETLHKFQRAIDKK